jgi:hypothetical protein
MVDNSELIISVLTKYGIEYWEEGKNVTNDTINIECPLCSDSSNHCGIFKDSLRFACWKCGQRGSFSFILSVLTGIPKELCKQELEEISTSFSLDSEQQIYEILNFEEEEFEVVAKKFEGGMPDFMVHVKEASSLLLENYLYQRNIDLQTLIDHDCRICVAGKYMNRLIIPVVFEGNTVGFQAADLTLSSKLKYKADGNNSIIKEYFYNWDNIDWNLGFVVVVEGVLDAWRLRDNTIASFGTSLSSNQRTILKKSKVKKLILCPDSDAYLDTLRMAEEFSPFVDEVHTVFFPIGEDPDSLGFEASWDLINKECFV